MRRYWDEAFDDHLSAAGLQIENRARPKLLDDSNDSRKDRCFAGQIADSNMGWTNPDFDGARSGCMTVAGSCSD
jgi:hypothetical protein